MVIAEKKRGAVQNTPNNGAAVTQSRAVQGRTVKRGPDGRVQGMAEPVGDELYARRDPRRAAQAADNDLVVPSSGNIFADFGLEDAGEMQLKGRLASAIQDIISERGLTQAEAAKQLGIKQPHVSQIKHFDLDRFSVDRLMQFINRFGYGVNIKIELTPHVPIVQRFGEDE